MFGSQKEINSVRRRDVESFDQLVRFTTPHTLTYIPYDVAVLGIFCVVVVFFFLLLPLLLPLFLFFACRHFPFLPILLQSVSTLWKGSKRKFSIHIQNTALSSSWPLSVVPLFNSLSLSPSLTLSLMQEFSIHFNSDISC